MKRDIAQFVAQCLVCQQVKAEHQRPARFLQPLSIPEWKWEHITMDFVTGLPRTLGDNDTIWVIVDRLTKSANFLPMKVNFSMDRLASLYIKEIVKCMVMGYYLPLVEFAYNNSFQASIGMTPFEALYGLDYEEVPVQIVDVMDKVLRHAVVKLVKVQWSNHSIREPLGS
ncbi:Transposon Ty3-I Gag-Pol polyprotein [Vitis vinifera]|uniref:Transposon Ty3-I Gag-Pol polyprotein n=1 Tax=Vitis vinifera TaxID=29760 RepID=A0A438HW48_VITVI|nr:Transposon Ty3-I Gag-Pol polyprotein [Vitis vinifera]